MTEGLDPVELAMAATEVYGVFFDRVSQLTAMLVDAEKIPNNGYQIALLSKAIELANSNFGAFTKHSSSHTATWESHQ